MSGNEGFYQALASEAAYKIKEMEVEIDRLKAELAEVSLRRDETVMMCEQLQAELENKNKQLSGLENEYVLLNSYLEAIESILNGGGTSDFMESFPIVRAIADIKSELARSHKHIQECHNLIDGIIEIVEINKGRCISPVTPRSALYQWHIDWLSRAKAALEWKA